MQHNEVAELQSVNPDRFNNEAMVELKLLMNSSSTGVVKMEEDRIPAWKKQKLRMFNKPIPVQIQLPLRR